jgi:hypothetical protein
MNDLAGFSEWTLALLPRLFLYPGGLWLLAVVVAFRSLAGGRHRISLGALSADFLRTDLFDLAIAWAAVALLPIGGALLPFPTDRLAIAGLLSISLAFDSRFFTAQAQRFIRGQGPGTRYWRLGTELAILAAVVALIAGQRTLLDVNSGFSAWISLVAVLVGVASLASRAAGDFPLAARLVGWLGLASTPLWTLSRLQDPIRVVIAFTILVLAACIAGRVLVARIRAGWSTAVVCTLAALSLLTALLLP